MHFRQVQSHKMGYQLQSTGKWMSLQVRRKFITTKSIWNIRISIYHQWFPKLKSTYMNLICFQSVFFLWFTKWLSFFIPGNINFFFWSVTLKVPFVHLSSCPSAFCSVGKECDLEQRGCQSVSTCLVAMPTSLKD